MSGEMLLTPPASAASPAVSTASTLARLPSTLPVPRKHPLPSGSTKQIKLIHYLDGRLDHVYRRHEKRVIPGQEASRNSPEQDDAPGYKNMEEVVEDLSPLIDVVWVSRTPSLQTAYLLTIANYIESYLADFTFSPVVFPILTKIDEAFVALLSAPAEDSLLGTNNRSPSKTDRIRIKSLAEETRIAAVNAATRSGWSADLDDSEDEFESEVLSVDFPETYDDSAINAGLGRIYKGTIEILGDTLD